MRQILSRFCRFQVIFRGFWALLVKRAQTFCVFGKFLVLPVGIFFQRHCEIPVNALRFVLVDVAV